MSWWTTDRKLYALRYLLSAGLSPYGAAGLVSRWANVESTASGPSSRGGYLNRAWGIAQWLGDRLPPINGNSNFDAQLAYVVQELNGQGAPGAAGGSAAVLRNASNISEGARGASMYERAGGYNPATGIDNYTARTAQGMPAILALLNQPLPGSGSGVSLNPVIPDASIFDFGSDEADPNSIAGIVKTASAGGVLLAVGATVLIVYLISSR